MKLLVFAHTPPPHHGQSYMVKLMLDGLGGDRRRATPGRVAPAAIECYHVNCRYSEDLEDIGVFRLEKMWLVLRYCLEAIWCRYRFGANVFYYVPAPGKRAALYRDWVTMLLCRPFFRHVICHWHAVGLGDWLEHEGHWIERWLTHRLLGRSALGIALAIPSMRDALWFVSCKVATVPNGIPDPCSDFDADIRPRRESRRAARRALLSSATPPQPQPAGSQDDPGICRVLYLAHCTREKGLFDTIEGVLAANEELRVRQTALRFHLTVAGGFVSASEENEFRAAISVHTDVIDYAGFVRDQAKAGLLAGSDVFCFPTFYAAEGQPVNLIEAIAHGLPIVTTRWRAVPEILPADYPGFVAPECPREVARALLAAAGEDGSMLRAHFLARYTFGKYVDALREVIRFLDPPPAHDAVPAAAR